MQHLLFSLAIEDYHPVLEVGDLNFNFVIEVLLEALIIFSGEKEASLWLLPQLRQPNNARGT